MAGSPHPVVHVESRDRAAFIVVPGGAHAVGSEETA
jgi:hypothetical protein